MSQDTLKINIYVLGAKFYRFFFSRASRMLQARLSQSGCRVCVWKFFSDQPLSPSWFDRSR